MDHRGTDRAAVTATSAYRELLRRRRRLVWSMATVLFGLLMALTAVTVFTELLDGQVVPGLNGAIIAAYVLFLAPVAFAHLYVARVRDLDGLALRALAEARDETTGE